jgi:hypothetical protein
MFMIDYKQINWWYWLATACVLTAGVAGYKTGFGLAVAISVIQVVHFLMRERSVKAFTVQVRIVVLIYLLVALMDPTQILFWIAVAGTWARSIFGYCLMARTVSLFPWNLRSPFSLKLITRTYFSRPVRGNIMQGLPPVSQTVAQPMSSPTPDRSGLQS